MSDTENIADLQLQHLLKLVEQRRDNDCAQLLDKAKQQAADILNEAYRGARSRLHEEIHAARDRSEKKLTAAVAEQHTRWRQECQRQEQALLGDIWQPLSEALLKRWQNPVQQKQWIESVLTQANTNLLDKNWQLHCPDDLPMDQRRDLQRRQAERGIQLEVQTDPQLEAGIRITTATTEIDASLSGILAHRTRIESSVLAHLRKHNEQDPSHE